MVKAPAPARPAAMTVPSQGVKHPLEQEDTKPRAANYNAAAKPMGQPPQHGQDAKRRRTDEAEDKEIITSKPMRVSVVKQVTPLPPISYASDIEGRQTHEIHRRTHSSSLHCRTQKGH